MTFPSPLRRALLTSLLLQDRRDHEIKVSCRKTIEAAKTAAFG